MLSPERTNEGEQIQGTVQKLKALGHAFTLGISFRKAKAISHCPLAAHADMVVL